MRAPTARPLLASLLLSCGLLAVACARTPSDTRTSTGNSPEGNRTGGPRGLADDDADDDARGDDGGDDSAGNAFVPDDRSHEKADPNAAPPPGEGKSCTVDRDCGAGLLCEGEGCGENQGVCRASSRMCTRDLQTYCDCQGNQFEASGSCPGRRYAKRGPCRAN